MEVIIGTVVARQHDQAHGIVQVLFGRGRVVDIRVRGAENKRDPQAGLKRDVGDVGHLVINGGIAVTVLIARKDEEAPILLINQQNGACGPVLNGENGVGPPVGGRSAGPTARARQQHDERVSGALQGCLHDGKDIPVGVGVQGFQVDVIISRNGVGGQNVPARVRVAVAVNGEVHLLLALVAPHDSNVSVEAHHGGDVVAAQPGSPRNRQRKRRSPVIVPTAAGVVDHHFVFAVVVLLHVGDPENAGRILRDSQCFGATVVDGNGKPSVQRVGPAAVRKAVQAGPIIGVGAGQGGVAGKDVRGHIQATPVPQHVRLALQAII